MRKKKERRKRSEQNKNKNKTKNKTRQTRNGRPLLNGSGRKSLAQNPHQNPIVKNEKTRKLNASHVFRYHCFGYLWRRFEPNHLLRTLHTCWGGAWGEEPRSDQNMMIHAKNKCIYSTIAYFRQTGVQALLNTGRK